MLNQAPKLVQARLGARRELPAAFGSASWPADRLID
jgi:hypothetical protein